MKFQCECTPVKTSYALLLDWLKINFNAPTTINLLNLVLYTQVAIYVEISICMSYVITNVLQRKAQIKFYIDTT